MSTVDAHSRAQGAAPAIREPLEHIRCDTLERITHYLSAPKLRVYLDLKRMCDRVSDSYRDRVVTELLQNAHDAHPAGAGNGRVHIALDPNEGPFGTLYVANDGHGFTRANFEALCSPTLTTKNVNEAIGNKGVGFLSVFQVSAHPEIYSRLSPDGPRFDGYCFSFAADETLREFLENEGLQETAELIIANMPRLYLACPAALEPEAIRQFALSGFATVIRLPLKAPDALLAVQKQLANLAAEDPPMQLFLKRIKELRVSADPQKATKVLGREAELVHAVTDLRISKVKCGARGYVVAEKTIAFETIIQVIRRDIAAEKLPDTWETWTGDAIVSVAVAADGNPLDARLYNFLPMGANVAAPFAGYLDAPFLATLDRLNVQRGVELNDFLWEAARELAIDAAVAARDCLPREVARHVVLDLIVWSDEHEIMRLRLLNMGAKLIPTFSTSGKPTTWSALSSARIWHGDGFLNSSLVARYAAFPILDDAIGAGRVQTLLAFVSGTDLLACGVKARADIVEGVAKALVDKRSNLTLWDQFYASLAALFRNDFSVLAGRRILLDSRGELKDAEPSVAVQPGRGRGRRRRLRAMFLPPLRGAGAHTPRFALPKAVQQRLSFLHEGLDLAKNQASPARRFLLAANLVREHESREILRLLGSAINDPGEARNPEALRWEALTAMMRIVADEDTADGVIAELNPLVPTREGWSRASSAYFSRWPNTHGVELERLFERAAGLSPEFDEHGARLLRPYPDWPVVADEREQWTAFLLKAGVSDLLRPVLAISGPMPRGWPNALQPALIQRGNLPIDQRARWAELLPNPWDVTNPQTDYSAKSVYRLPGQLDFDILGPIIAPEYAEAIVRLLETMPEIVNMTVFRPGHPQQPNQRNWPSPIAAFLRSAKWVPLADGRHVKLDKAWVPGEGRTPPPLLPLMSLDLRRVISACPKAAEILRNAGSPEFGTSAAAWHFLTIAGALVVDDTPSGDAERLFNAAQEAWLIATLDIAPPKEFHILGRRGGRITAVDPSGAGNKLLIADGDDRQLLAATVRADSSAVLIEPPPARADAIARYLAQHFPAAIQRASQIEARYESCGELIVVSPLDPTLEEAFGDGMRQILALTLRYRASFYRGNPQDTLARLSLVRARKLPSLYLRVGEFSEPVPRFDQRAVLLSVGTPPTILYSEALAASGQLLIGLAPAIAKAIGAPNIIGEPLLAFAAELGAHGLTASVDDFAAILNVPVGEVKSVLGAARASITDLLRTIRPFIAYFAGLEEADRCVAGSGMAHENDLIAALDRIADRLPEPPKDLVRRCRDTSEVATIAIRLRVDLGRLNEVIAALGAPYVAIDLAGRHQATLATFLGRKESVIRESIRETFRPAFHAGEILSGYVAARDAARPTLPTDFGLQHVELTTAEMQGWLDQWMTRLGIQPHAEPASQRQNRDAIRDSNLRLVRALMPEFRIAVLARAEPNEPLRGRYLKLPEAEAAAIHAALSEGWVDFERLNQNQVAFWLTLAGLWPTDWPSLGALAITDEERVVRTQEDEKARIAATTVKRQMPYSGGVFTFGVDAMGSLADQITGLVAGNATLLQTSARTLKGTAPNIRPSTGGSGSGGGGGSSTRLNDDERNLIGFFGEAIAFEWLKRRFGTNRLVDENSWKSMYRRHVFGENGDDSLGYDFEIVNGATHWYFEVKSTTKPGPLQVQSLELGPSEFRRAEACKADRLERYRILYVTDALNPDKARIFQLPNPRTREGMTFFADLHAGHRLYFPLKP